MGSSVGRHVDQPCGWQISPWAARKVIDSILGDAPEHLNHGMFKPLRSHRGLLG